MDGASQQGGGPRVVVSTAAFHARVRGSVPGLGGLKETKMFLPHPRVKVSIVGSLRDREVACLASHRQGSNFESCVWRTVSSQSSHHLQEVLLAQFSLYVHKGGLKPDSFHFSCLTAILGSITKWWLLCTGKQQQLLTFQASSYCCLSLWDRALFPLYNMATSRLTIPSHSFSRFWLYLQARGGVDSRFHRKCHVRM